MNKNKKQISISIDRSLFNIVEKNVSNYSKYIEWLIYQDMMRNKVDGINKIII